MTPREPTPSSASSDSARIAAEAAAWFVQQEEGFSAEQAGTFSQWRAADSRHAAAFARAEATHLRLTALPRSPAAAKLLVELEALEQRRKSSVLAPVISFFTSRPLRATCAAVAAAACVGFVVWFAASSRATHDGTFSTTAMVRRAIDLPDGSMLALSEQSTVHVEFRESERRLQLERGEAHFAVAKDASRPFRVFAGTVLVQAVGTAFTVQRTNDSVEVAVTEGKVAVSRTSDSANSQNIASTSASGGETFALVAGERVLLDLRPSALTAEKNPGAARSAVSSSTAPMRWPAPRLVFRDTPLSEVVERFNRFNRVQLVIADPRLASRLVGGSFDADNAEAFVNLLRESGTIAGERVSETRIELRATP